MNITCGTCNGDGFVSFGDRHVENRKEVCGECGGHGRVEARTGETPGSSAPPSGDALYADESRRHTRALPAESLADPRVAVARALDPAPVATTAWTYQFDEHGGRDFTSSGYHVRENGTVRFTIDVAEMPDFDVSAEWDEAHRRYDSAEALAKAVVAALNAAGHRTRGSNDGESQ